MVRTGVEEESSSFALGRRRKLGAYATYFDLLLPVFTIKGTIMFVHSIMIY